MKKAALTVVLLGGIGLCSAAEAGDPGEEHATLAARAGEYRLTVRFWPVPGGEPEISTLGTRRRMILGGRVLRSEVGPDAGGFEGTGLMGFDRATGKFWYVWTDTSGTGYSLLEGTIGADGGTLEGTQATPAGPSPLRVEIRREGVREIHDYLVPGEDGRTVRFLELSFEPR